MAQPALIPFRKKLLAVAVADASLTSASNAIQILNGSSSTERDQVEDDADSAFMGGKASTPTKNRAFVEGGIQFVPPTIPGHATSGKSTQAPILKPCAMAETLTALSRLTRYNPISSSFPLCDFKFWHGDTLLNVSDARGNITGLKMEIGARFSAQMRLEGPYAAMTDVALPTDGDLSAFTNPTVSRSTNSTMIISSLGAAAISNLHLRAKMLSVDFGNEIAVKEYTEFTETGINDRKPTWTARFAKPSLTDFNPTTLADTGELVTIAYKISESDGRYSKLVIRGQILTVPPSDIEGDYGYEITGSCIPSSSGGDEFYIEFGDDTFQLNGTLPGGVNGALSPSYTFTASGVYTAPLHTWSVFSGALPTGLSINSSTGAITGTFGAAGSFTFVIKVKDTDAGTDLEAVTSSQTVVVTA